jgi:acyl CoA:acetate/3-ketoacid CoA transferase beta subunit
MRCACGLDITPGGLVVREMNPGMTLESLQDVTGARFTLPMD